MKGWEERRAAANNPVSKQEANVVRKYLDLLPTDKIDVLFGEKFDEKLQELDVKGYKPPAFFRITKDNRLELGLSDTATAENFIHEATHAWLSGLNGKDVKTLRELTRGMKGRQTTIEGGNAVNSSRIFDEGFDLTTPEGMEAATDLVMQRLTERDTGGDTVLDKFVRQIKDLFTALKAFLAKNDLAVPKKVKEFIDKIVDQAEEKYLASKTVEQNAIARTNQQIAAADNNEKVVGFIRSYIRTVDDRYEISTEGLKENADAVEWVEFVHEKANKAGENRTELSETIEAWLEDGIPDDFAAALEVYSYEYIKTEAAGEYIDKAQPVELPHDTNTTMGEIGKWLKHPLEFGNILVNGKKLADTLFALEEIAAKTKMTISEVQDINALMKSMLGDAVDEIRTDIPYERLTEAQRAQLEAAEGTYRGVTIPIEGKQVVRYSPTADISTAAHEPFHGYIRKLAPEKQNEWAQAIGLQDRAALEKAYTAEDGKVYKNGHEYLAEKWEEYLTLDNPSIPQRLKALFDRIVKVMRELVGREAKIPEQLKAKFDELARGEARIGGPTKLADVVEIDTSVMVDQSGKAIDLKNTRALTEWVLDRYMPKNGKGVREGLEVTIADDGTIQKFTAHGIESSTKKRNSRKKGEAQRKTYAGLDNLIKSAVFSHFEEADAKHPGLKGQNVYYVPARFGEQIYSARIKIDIPIQKELIPAFKDIKIEKEITPSLYRGQTLENQHGTTQETSGTISKVNVDILRGVVNPTGMKPDGNGGHILFQDAYHGTPHYIVGGLTTEKIGTGEGAQAYGWGLYAAGDRKTSEWYQKKLSEDNPNERKFKNKNWEGGYFVDTNAGTMVNNLDDEMTFAIGELNDDNNDKFAARFYVEAGHDRGAAIELLNKAIEDGEVGLSDERKGEIVDTINSFEEMDDGYLYKVTVPEVNELLDWDKPLNEQPEAVKEKLTALFADRMTEHFTGVPEDTGENIYRSIASEQAYNGVAYGDRAQFASKLLKEYGIKGIQYLDGNSRGAGEGSRNYVVFADEDIEIQQMLFQPEKETESADNQSVGEDEYKKLAAQTWNEAVNHKNGEPIEKKEFTIQEDKNGRHFTDTQRIRHIYKTHGNEKSERAYGNIAITENDIVKLQDIIANADYIIKNILYDNKKTIIYAKHNAKGTYIYIERPSNRKHGNITETFFNLYKQKDENLFLRIIANNKRYSNAENAEIITGSGGGGNPSSQEGHNAVPAVANSARPADTSLSPASGEKSSGISGPLFALEENAAAENRAQFSKLVNSFLGDSGYNDLLWIGMNADTKEQAVEYARKMYGDDAAGIEEHFFDFAKKHEKKIEENIAKTGLVDTEIADEFDRLIEDSTVINTIRDAGKFIKEAENNPQGSGEDESYLKSVERATRNTLWQMAIATDGELNPKLLKNLKSLIKNRSTSYRGLYAAITGDERFAPTLSEYEQQIMDETGGENYSPEEYEKIRQRAIAKKAQDLIASGKIPTADEVEELRRELNVERKSMQNELDKYEMKLAKYEAAIEEQKKHTAIKYKAALLARKNLDTGAEAALRGAIIAENELSQDYLRLIDNLSSSEKQAVNSIMESNLKLVESEMTRQALDMYEKHLSAAWKRALAKPSGDIDVIFRDDIENIRLVAGNTANKRYLQNLSKEGMMYVGTMFDRYNADPAFKKEVERLFGKTDKAAMADIEAKSWGELTKSEKRRLGRIFGRHDVRQSAIVLLLDEKEGRRKRQAEIKAVKQRQLIAQRLDLVFRTVDSAIFAASSRMENAGVFTIREVKSVSSSIRSSCRYKGAAPDKLKGSYQAAI